jgi:hypothetical protein
MTRATCFLLLCLLATPAAAQDTASEAQFRYGEAQRLAALGRFSEAAEHILASYRLVPNPNAALSAALIYEQLRRYDGAYNWYETVLTAHEPTADQRDRATRGRDALLRRVAVVEVETSPPGASLFVDDERFGSIGRSPRRVAAEAGPRRVIARLDRHRTASAEIEARRGEVTPLRIELTPLTGTLVVESTPAGAEVRVEGRAEPLGVTPLTVVLPVGSAALTVSAADHGAVERRIEIQEGRETRLALTLTRSFVAPATVLSVRGNPAGATVLLDGRPIGTAPLAREDLEPGPESRRIEVQADGRLQWSSELTLERGGATRVEFDLAEPPALPRSTFRLLGYGGSGALIAAGGILAILARTARSSFFDTDNPSRSALDRVHRRNVTADVLFAVGLASGLTVLILDLVIDVPESSGAIRLDR